MKKSNYLKSALIGSASAMVLAASAHAAQFNIPAGDLATALDVYSRQTGVDLIIAGEAVRGARTKGAKGDLTADVALARILSGTGFATRQQYGAIAVVQDVAETRKTTLSEGGPLKVAAASAASSIESVLVTAQKKTEDIQTVPIAVTALSSEQLQAMKVEGGPDLLKEVPNMSFTKTNFTSYNIQIRGIGTQAISVTTDPAVAVAFNGTPFIRNHLFEQEFFDVQSVEVLRGPQGTLYGRNATAGVVNVISAKPTDQWEASAKVEVGNYNTRRLVGMLNAPIIGDKLDLRIAGAWTKRNGYAFNETTNKPIDGRDLWSSRVTIGFRPLEGLQADFVWEHFSESDDRARSTKQLCKKDPGANSIDGLDVPTSSDPVFYRAWTSQGCLPTSLYGADAFETPNGQSIPFVAAGQFAFNGYAVGGNTPGGFPLNQIDPYASITQSRDLRVIQSEISPHYDAKNDVVELSADYEVTPELSLSSQTGYNKDQLRSTEDFNRFNTSPGLFATTGTGEFGIQPPAPNGIYCDPQLGCSTKMVGEDLSQEHAWQFSQEFRLESSFSGPLNFSLGANYMHYQTLEDYYVFFNLITLEEQLSNESGPNEFTTCYSGFHNDPHEVLPVPYRLNLGNGVMTSVPGVFGCGGFPGVYIDPNPLESINGLGHNYFRSQNPYRLNSWAGFGEVYYQVAPDVKLTAGLRWTDDQKRFTNIPSWVFLEGGGYPIEGIVKQEWKKLTGRLNANWTPKLDFTDQTIVYASYSRGYKGGGANPPGPEADVFSAQSFIIHPATFKPEFVNAFELGTKNTLLDGSLTLNGDVFYYDYKGYQISQIVDRTSINLNFDSKVSGAELESTWEPVPGLRLNFAGGYESSSVNKGQSAIDLMDRTQGHSDWMVVKPYIASTSNCVFPTSVVRQIIENNPTEPTSTHLFAALVLACEYAYGGAGNPFLGGSDPTLSNMGVVGFNANQSPNGGAGFKKDVGGNDLPNTPHFTLSFGAQYGMPVSEDWTGVLRGDFYWQSQSYARIFNDRPYDKLRGWSNVNLSLMFLNSDGWAVEGYVKNVFDTTAITGAFLNSDDTALTTNVFVTDPRLMGFSITKTF